MDKKSFIKNSELILNACYKRSIRIKAYKLYHKISARCHDDYMLQFKTKG
ncbi:hypothetical protein V7D15_13215 [Thermoanaerobacter thermohydrosulfuricus]|nr:hypothetical protein [Thermoanaerobacter sp. RKWS2]UZQ82954.1 hypothetical protein OEI98_002911 [Thermoanaerobacter sp. RKWS2]